MLSYKESTFNKLISVAVLIIIATVISIMTADAGAKAKKERVRMKMYYSKNDAGERVISIGLTAGSGRKMHGLKNAPVLLETVFNDSTTLLATVETDSSGLVDLYLAQDYKLPVNEDGVAIIMAAYEGDDTYRSASRKLEIVDLELDFNFEIEDSVKYLKVSAGKIDGEGNKLPVEGLEIDIGIQRLYSVLPIGSVETEKDGTGILEVQDDLPGDAKGMLTFVANIEDHDEFGTVTKTATEKWGIPVSYEVKPLPRQLYTDEAPLWMIALVVVTLAGAWYHFFLSVSKLIKLRKAGQERL